MAQSAGDSNRVTVVVSGDVTMDCNIAHIPGSSTAATQCKRADFSRACWQRGGAALLAELIETLGKQLSALGSATEALCHVAVPEWESPSGNTDFARTYAVWEPTGERHNGTEGPWRVTQFLGLDPAEAAPEAVRDDHAGAAIVVLDDADLGFRACRDAWPRAITEQGRDPWVVLKMSAPVAQGPLWEHLIHTRAHRLIVVITAADLRHTAGQISQRISWERTAEDVAWELTHNPALNELSRAAHTVVSFDHVGALLLTAQDHPPARAELLFDPNTMEGEWQSDQPGNMVGNTATLCAALVHQLLLKPVAPDLPRGLRNGVGASRHLFDIGYDAGNGPTPQLRFPFSAIASAISATPPKFALAPVQPPLRAGAFEGDGEAPENSGDWAILDTAYPDDVRSVAEDIVLRGVSPALSDVPVATFGHLCTVDRREIESLRSIRELIGEYCGRPESQPLSIAVFGPPGAGKSFAVKQVTASIPNAKIKALTFNLSQLAGPDALLGCFHQVRDLALSGTVPLVFWDEFDSTLQNQELGWLRYFLVPMQDGEFQEGQLCHPIGKAIFVFAGGTAERMNAFGAMLDDVSQRNRKVPDFTSRLRGFIDILGPNRQPRDGYFDHHFVIRRAIVLRSMFERITPQLFNPDHTLQIDKGILHGLLGVSRFRHGARSMEALISSSTLAHANRFERSSLPPEALLDLHVAAEEFLALVNRLELTGPLLQNLAEALHEDFCKQLRNKGYRYGERTDDKLKTHSSLVVFNLLSEHEKQQNREAAQDIPRKLATQHYAMMPDRRGSAPPQLTDMEVDTIAEQEHRRWMAMKLADGWICGPVTDKLNMIHKDLRPYSELPESEREKDREQVRKIPSLLANVGYTIVKVGDEITDNDAPPGTP